MIRAAPSFAGLPRWLLALALLLRLLVPTGWMPAAGSVALVPCSGLGPAPSPMHGGGHHAATPSQHDGHSGPQQDHDGKASQLCAFAGLALAWTGGDAPRLAPPPPADFAPVPLLRTRGDPRGAAAPPPPATGPPAA